MQGRERVVVLVMGLVVAVVVVGAWRLGVVGGDTGADADADADGPGSPPAEGPVRPVLASAHYDPGDCVTWDVEGFGETGTDVVPCTAGHRIQITEEVPVANEGHFPTAEEWGFLVQAQCGPAAERFLDVPLDPYGRFYPDVIHPLERGWSVGENTMWCGIGWAGPRDGTDDELFTEDARGADQAYHYPAGSCVATPDGASPVLVPCAEPHHMEIVGEIDLSERPEAPVGAQERALFDDCAAQARTYLGADPVAPWQSGKEVMTPESWAAGSRVVHCFLGQWDADDRLVEVTASAKA
jgi:Septum formation